MTINKKNKPKRSCFIITPIGEEGSVIRRSTDGLIDAVLAPVLNSLGISYVASHKMPEPGQITNQVINHLLEDDVVIANLSGFNPNVMYELAVRHSCAKPAILLIESGGARMPFDISNQRAIFFTNDFQGQLDLTASLKASIEFVLQNKEASDNPVFQVARDSIISKIEETDPNKLVIEQLQEIRRQIQNLTYRSGSISPSVPVSVPHFAGMASASGSVGGLPTFDVAAPDPARVDYILVGNEVSKKR